MSLVRDPTEVPRPVISRATQDLGPHPVQVLPAGRASPRGPGSPNGLAAPVGGDAVVPGQEHVDGRLLSPLEVDAGQADVHLAATTLDEAVPVGTSAVLSLTVPRLPGGLTHVEGGP